MGRGSETRSGREKDQKMLTCREVIEDFLADYLDGTLRPEVVADLKEHLQACQACMAYLNTYRKSRDLFGQASQVEMPEEMKAILRRFLLQHFPKKAP